MLQLQACCCLLTCVLARNDLLLSHTNLMVCERSYWLLWRGRERLAVLLNATGFASENGFQSSDKSFKTGHTFSNNGETWIEVRAAGFYVESCVHHGTAALCRRPFCAVPDYLLLWSGR